MTSSSTTARLLEALVARASGPNERTSARSGASARCPRTVCPSCQGVGSITIRGRREDWWYVCKTCEGTRERNGEAQQQGGGQTP
jgi:DnaJ-class molecular chaperone